MRSVGSILIDAGVSRRRGCSAPGCLPARRCAAPGWNEGTGERGNEAVRAVTPMRQTRQPTAQPLTGANWLRLPGIASGPWPNSYSDLSPRGGGPTYRRRYGEPNESPPLDRTLSVTAACPLALFIDAWPMAYLNPAEAQRPSASLSPRQMPRLYASEPSGNRCLVPDGSVPHGGLYDRPQHLRLYMPRLVLQCTTCFHSLYIYTPTTTPTTTATTTQAHHLLLRIPSEHFTLIHHPQPSPIHPPLPPLPPHSPP
jgi:hypothetical protein